jgi:hypothetical protein
MSAKKPQRLLAGVQKGGLPYGLGGYFWDGALAVYALVAIENHRPFRRATAARARQTRLALILADTNYAARETVTGTARLDLTGCDSAPTSPVGAHHRATIVTGLPASWR